jgi:hypothetical protein
MAPALALAAALATLQPAGAGIVTQLEEEARPEEIVRQLFGEMGRILFPITPIAQRSLPLRGIRALHFYTRPYGAGLAGICQTDMIVVTFEPVPGSGLRDDSPVQPSRIYRYDNSYFVADLPRTRKREVDHEGSCSGIDPRTMPLIVASRSGEVVDAVADFADLIDAARAGRASVQLDCRSPRGEPLDQAGCLKLLARYRPERIHSIATVPGCGRAARDAYCHRIHTSIAIDASGLELRSGELEILFESPRSDAGPMPPARVQVRPAPPDLDSEH